MEQEEGENAITRLLQEMTRIDDDILPASRASHDRLHELAVEGLHEIEREVERLASLAQAQGANPLATQNVCERVADIFSKMRNEAKCLLDLEATMRQRTYRIVVDAIILETQERTAPPPPRIAIDDPLPGHELEPALDGANLALGRPQAPASAIPEEEAVERALIRTTLILK